MIEVVAGGRMGFPVAVTGELKHLGVVLEEGRAVADADHGGPGAGELPVKVFLVGDVEGAGRFVENGEGRLCQQQAREGEALLFADRQHLLPVQLDFEATTALGEVG